MSFIRGQQWQYMTLYSRDNSKLDGYVVMADIIAGEWEYVAENSIHSFW